MDITVIIAKVREIMEEWFALKENVPTKTSDLINDNDFITNSDISEKENISNKVTSLSSTSTDTQYPSAKLVKDSLDNTYTKTEIDALIGNIEEDMLS